MANKANILHLAPLRNISMRKEENGFVVALVDDEGFRESPTSAMNDMLRNLF